MSGLGRIHSYALLLGFVALEWRSPPPDLERRGLCERDPYEGLLVTFSGRMRAGFSGDMTSLWVARWACKSAWLLGLLRLGKPSPAP